MKSLEISKKYDGKKLIRVLLDTFPGLTMNELYKTLRKKDIKINGKRIHEDINVFAGDIVEIYISDNILHANNNPCLNIIYEDEFILIVNKPTGLEVVGSNSLTSILQEKYSYISPCHRIDRNTTGLVLFAKNETALNILLDKFKNQEIEKHYACLVYGIPKETSKTITSYLFKDAKKSFVYIADTPKKGYQKIVTSYNILKKNDNNTCLLDVTLHTGRTHQIRAHLSHLGYPIIGDGKYGNNEINKKFHKKTQMLCSYSIKFVFTSDANILNYLNNKDFHISIEENLSI